ncbi:MAG: hypothetical protein YK1312THETA_130005 [Marine Group I thaumarchaeote]|nr:MAG: hypothetical protein YK1312THETA_130005 [Marine Group I thaumarchaeote]
MKKFSAELDQGLHSNLTDSRSALKRVRDESSKWNSVKKGGLNSLSGSVRESAIKIIDFCKQQGLFLVPKGELESWIDTGTRIKKNWIIKALNQLENKSTPEDLDNFISEVVNFLNKYTIEPKLK